MSEFSADPDSLCAGTSLSSSCAPPSWDNSALSDAPGSSPTAGRRRLARSEPRLEGWGLKTSRFLGKERRRWLVLFPDGTIQSFDRPMSEKDSRLTETLRGTRVLDPPDKDLNLRQLHLWVSDKRLVKITFNTLIEAQRWQRTVIEVLREER